MGEGRRKQDGAIVGWAGAERGVQEPQTREAAAAAVRGVVGVGSETHEGARGEG